MLSVGNTAAIPRLKVPALHLEGLVVSILCSPHWLNKCLKYAVRHAIQTCIVTHTLTDGPSGVADWQTQVTTFPSSLTMAASWDVDAMYEYGKAMGEEQRGKGFFVENKICQ